MRFVRFVNALLIVVLIGTAVAQEITGDIRGIVTDASGAVVSGADVQIVNVDRDTLIRDLKTGTDGSYVAAYLRSGSIALPSPHLASRPTTRPISCSTSTTVGRSM